jgi:hypothetical protein
MKASPWSVNVVHPLPIERPQFHLTSAKVFVTLRRQLPTGQFERLRIEMTASEAEEFAASIAAPRPKLIPHR